LPTFVKTGGKWSITMGTGFDEVSKERFLLLLLNLIGEQFSSAAVNGVALNVFKNTAKFNVSWDIHSDDEKKIREEIINLLDISEDKIRYYPAESNNEKSFALRFSSDEIVLDQDVGSSDQDVASDQDEQDDSEEQLRKVKNHKRSHSFDAHQKRNPGDLFEEKEKKEKEKKKEVKKEKTKNLKQNIVNDREENTDVEIEKPDRIFISTKKKPPKPVPKIEATQTTEINEGTTQQVQPIHILFLVVFLALIIGISWRT